MSRGARLALHAVDPGLTDADRLGRADYSYTFVKQYFARALAQTVDVIEAPTTADVRSSQAPALLFVPPHRLTPELARTGYAAFAWEYDTLPTDVWNDDPRNDWRTPLGWCRGAITHSGFAAGVTRAAMPAGYPVVSAPAPVWDRYAVGDPAVRPVGSPFELAFDGWVIDSRASGLTRSFVLTDIDVERRPRRLELDGRVYTAVVNPDDGRKNWVDTMSAFTAAFRDDPSATLVLKLVHHHGDRAAEIVKDMIYRHAPYQCRVVALFGYLPASEYLRLIEHTAFVVNSSKGEGQCLPLMEFMSAGVPAIAPTHTAMAEYVRPTNAFCVRTYRERTHWPHDPRMLLRCFGHQIDWSSLRDGYLASSALLDGDPQAYRRMCADARDAQRAYCSRAVVLASLDRLFEAAHEPSSLVVTAGVNG